ncbi:Restriction endonuclease subunit M [Enterobacterales bacterium 8AC]|nr:Restriction endonuclease subunit M [Enterobacterales bacterium 8AC]
MPTTLNTVIEPEVLTGHTEVICSTSIERIVTGRNAALVQIEALIHQLEDISAITSSIGGGVARDWAMKQDFRCGCWLMEKAETAMPVITRNLDRDIWRDLMKRSGMLSVMDAQARDQWYRNLESKDVPAVSTDSIYSTFEQLHRDKGEVFERGVINVFKSLSWDYKSNHPCKFGKKVIINGLVSYNQWGFTLNHSYRRDQLADLERMLHLLDGKTIPDNRSDLTARLYDHIRAHPQMAKVYEDEYFSIKYFMKGSAHLTFRKPELMDKMNDIIARHYPGVLPERV